MTTSPRPPDPPAFRASPRLSADTRSSPGDRFAAWCPCTTTQNGQPLSVGLFVFRGAPRRAGLRAILPVPGEAVTEPFSHGFAPLLPSLLSKHWPTGLFWHRHIPRPVSRLYVCRQDRFAVTSAPRSGEKTGDRGHRRRSGGQEGSGRGTRRRGQQPLAVGQGAGRRHGQHSRPSAPRAGISRVGAPQGRCQFLRQGEPLSPRSGAPGAKGRGRPGADTNR